MIQQPEKVQQHNGPQHYNQNIFDYNNNYINLTHDELNITTNNLNYTTQFENVSHSPTNHYPLTNNTISTSKHAYRISVIKQYNNNHYQNYQKYYNETQASNIQKLQSRQLGSGNHWLKHKKYKLHNVGEIQQPILNISTSNFNSLFYKKLMEQSNIRPTISLCNNKRDFSIFRQEQKILAAPKQTKRKKQPTEKQKNQKNLVLTKTTLIHQILYYNYGWLKEITNNSDLDTCELATQILKTPKFKLVPFSADNLDIIKQKIIAIRVESVTIPTINCGATK